MSDYDAVFRKVSGAQQEPGNPYDALMANLTKTRPELVAPESAPVSVKAGAALGNATGSILNETGRQLGLTARYGIEGLGQAAQLFSEPIRAVTDRLTGNVGKTVPAGTLASQFADTLGLPKPANADERVIGDATRMVAGSAGLAGTAQAVGGRVSNLLTFAGPGRDAVTRAPANIAQTLAANPGQQLASAAGAGLAGGAVREAGGDDLQQAFAAMLGGITSGLAVPAVGGLASKAADKVSRIASARNVTPQQLDAQISMTLERAGYDYSQVPANVRASLRADVQRALQTGDQISPEALSRLADFRRVGATPTRGMISQDPVQITREMNLAKTGANSADEGLQGLARIQNQNNATFIGNLNQQGAQRGDTMRAGQAVADAVQMRRADLRGIERQAWDAARQSPGYTQPIEANVISQINQALGDEGMMPFMNPTISRYMESFMTGQQPFTPQAYRNLQSMLANEMQAGGNPAAAAGIARRVLESAELRPITNPRGIDFGNALVTQPVAARMRAMDAQPADAIEAVNRARAATRAAYAYEESTPLVRAALSDSASSDPMRIAQRFVIGGTPNEARAVAQEVGPQGIPAIRDALVAHLKEKATSGANDEVGKFSQAAYNKALNAIGERKLREFFSPEEITQLRALGRVSSLAMNQPVGSAVNNSNSAAMLIGKGLDALAGFANAVPVIGPMVSQPATTGIRNLNIALQTRAAENVAPGLLYRQMPQQAAPMGAGMLLPGAMYGGSLLLPPP